MSLIEEKLCTHKISKWRYTKTECECCDPHDLNTYNRIGCKTCVLASFNNLIHGGHYRTCKLYRDDKLKQHHGSHRDTPENRYIDMIVGLYEDLELDELQDIYNSISNKSNH
jgi:hypothetical protein